MLVIYLRVFLFLSCVWRGVGYFGTFEFILATCFAQKSRETPGFTLF